jgi:hypothetical protein
MSHKIYEWLSYNLIMFLYIMINNKILLSSYYLTIDFVSVFWFLTVLHGVSINDIYLQLSSIMHISSTYRLSLNFFELFSKLPKIHHQERRISLMLILTIFIVNFNLVTHYWCIEITILGLLDLKKWAKT